MRLTHKTMVCFLAATIASSGCENTETVSTVEHAIGQEQLIYRGGSYTDLAWWTHDDEEAADREYVQFSAQQYESGDAGGVFVDIPNCKPTDTFRVSFNGLSTGKWEYRAAVRLVVEQNDVESEIHGAQLLLSQPSAANQITPIHISGVFTVPSNSASCRVGLKGKVFAGTLSLFGGATLLVERHR